MIDIHSHVLGGVDDGAKNIQYAIEIARIAQMSGTKHMIATPHYITGLYDVPYKQIREKVKELNDYLQRLNMHIQIYPGQEVGLEEAILTKIKSGEVGTLNDSPYILIEFEGDGVTPKDLKLIDELRNMGLWPIIAHIERYKEIPKHREMLNELIKRKCYMQCNVNALNGVDGRKAQKWAKTLVELGCVHLIASDAHSIGRRNPEMQSGIEELEEMGNSLLAKQLKDNAQCVLEGIEIPYNTPMIAIAKRHGLAGWIR